MTVRETSRAALETVPLGERQKAVLKALDYLGAATDLEIANHLALPINCITGRRGELVAMGLVIERGHTIQHGRKALTWSLKSRVKPTTQEAQGALFA